MKNNAISNLLFDAWNKQTEQFDFSYNEKIKLLTEEKQQREDKIINEQQKIDNLQELIDKLNKNSSDAIYNTRIQQSQISIETYRKHIQQIEENIQYYLSVNDEETSSSIDTYIQEKKQSLENIMALEKERKLQTINTINNSIEESEQKIRNLFGEDQELINQINTDKALLIAENEYKLSDKNNQIVQSYQKLIDRRQQHRTPATDPELPLYQRALLSEDQKKETNDLFEKLNIGEKIEVIYNNIVEDHKYFAKMRNPETLDKFCKDCLDTDKETIPLTEFLMEGKYSGIDPKHIPKKGAQKLQRHGKSIAKLLSSSWASIGITPNKGTKVDPTMLTGLLNGNFDMLSGESTQDTHEEEKMQDAFEIIAKNMSLNTHMLRAADDYMKSLAAIPNIIDTNTLLPYIQEVSDIFKTLDSDTIKYDRTQLYEQYIQTFENHALFFGEYIQKHLGKVPQKYHYVFVPLFTEIIIATCMIAIGRSIDEKWGESEGNIATWSTLRAEVICEESANHQSSSNNSTTDFTKVNAALRMLNRMQRALDMEEQKHKNRLEEEQDPQEREKINRLIQRNEQDKDINNTFFKYYNYYTGIQNIKNTYTILFKNADEAPYNETQRSQVADLYFQNIDWTEVPYDDPIVIDQDAFLCKKTGDYAFEINRIADDERYLAMIKIGNFDAFAQDEHALNTIRKVLEITHRESKIQDLTARICYEGDNLIIRNFLNHAIVLVHQDGSFSINGHSSDSIRILLGGEEYNILRTYIFKYILESTSIIDKRDIQGPEQFLAQVPENDENFHRKDPRVIYDHNSTPNPLLTKIIDYRDDHRRLLPINMFPGVKGFTNAKQYQQPLYAHIYDIHADIDITKPIEKIRIDTYNTYEDMFNACRKIKEQHTTATTIIRFETYVQEFIKNNEVNRKTKMQSVKGGISDHIQETLHNLG